MANPQQPELRRSENTPLSPDSIGSDLKARKRPSKKKAAGKVPEDNLPGHHPAEEQDQPDPDDFVRRFSKGNTGNGAPAREPAEEIRQTSPPAPPDNRGVLEPVLRLTGAGLRLTALGLETAGWVTRRIADVVEPPPR